MEIVSLVSMSECLSTHLDVIVVSGDGGVITSAADMVRGVSTHFVPPLKFFGL
jgi:hypothetical protein